jgi:replication factor C subunit 1
MSGLFSSVIEKQEKKIKEDKIKIHLKSKIKQKQEQEKEKEKEKEKVVSPLIYLSPSLSPDPEKAQVVALSLEKLEKVKKHRSTLWAEKYRPTNLSEIVGNIDQITQIRDWFTKFKEHDPTIKKALLFSGCPGTSKTSIAHAMMKEFQYDIIEYNASDIRNKSQIDETLGKIIGMNRLEHDGKAFGIIMDEVDGMTSGDKGGMLQLIKIINPLKGKTSVKKNDKIKNDNRWIYPIICICNNNYDKKILELKKECLEIKFAKPSCHQLISVINNVSREENFKMDDQSKSKLAELSQGDYRRLMYLMQNLYTIWKSDGKLGEVMTCDIIYEHFETISKKYISLNYYESTNKIFSQPQLSVDEIYKLYEIEKSSLPMMIHENYLSIVEVQATTLKNKFENCKRFIDSVIMGDNIEKLMFTTQSWHLQNIHGITTCYFANYLSNRYTYVSQPSSKWTTTLSKFSSQKSNIKNINLLSLLINNGMSYRSEDMQILSDIILYNLLDENGNIQKGIDMLKHYNLSISDIEKLIRTNQLSDKYNNLYKSKNKTLLTKLYGQIKQREISSILYNQMKPKAITITIDDEEDESGGGRARARERASDREREREREREEDKDGNGDGSDDDSF